MINAKEILEKIGAKATDEEYEDFENRLIRKLWDEYNAECMEQATIIKNKIDAADIIFPNGTVNKEYKITINISKEDVDDYWFEGLDAIGLKEVIDGNSCVVNGIPLEAGSFDFKLCYKYKDGLTASLF